MALPKDYALHSSELDMIVPIYSLVIPSVTAVLTVPVQSMAPYLTEPAATIGPVIPTDPAPYTTPYDTAILRSKDPFDPLYGEERRRRSKQMRKAQRPQWRR